LVYSRCIQMKKAAKLSKTVLKRYFNAIISYTIQ